MIDDGADRYGTMSAKSLGTLVMIFATDELQNPLSRKLTLCEGDMNNSTGIGVPSTSGRHCSYEEGNAMLVPLISCSL